MAPQQLKQQQKPKPFFFRVDNKGDIKLLIGPDESQFIVNSLNLCRASSVFKSILSESESPDTPSQQDSNGNTTPELRTIKLPHDIPEAAIVVLSIIHYRFDAVPRYLSLGQLRIVCEFARKYDMIHPLRAWYRIWLASWDASFRQRTRPNPRLGRVLPRSAVDGRADGSGKAAAVEVKGREHREIRLEELDWGFKSRLIRLYWRIQVYRYNRH